METTAEIKGIFEALPYIKKIGAEHLWFDFDEEGCPVCKFGATPESN